MLELDTRPLGELVLAEAGSVAAGSPAEVTPIGLELPAGRYPVDLAVLDGRPAVLRVRIAAADAVHWRYAGTAAGQGVLAVGSTRAMAALAGPVGRELEVRATAGMEPGFVLEVDEDSLAAGICEEGAYDLFVGVDAGGAPVALVADLGVLVAPVEASADLGDLLALGEQALIVPGLTDRGIKVARVHAEDVVLALDFASVVTDPTIGGYELRWFDADGEALYGRSQGFGSKLSFSAPRGVRAARAELHWIASLRPL